MIAVQGTLLGLVVGIFFGWALVTAMTEEGLNTLAIPITSLLVVVESINALSGCADVMNQP